MWYLAEDKGVEDEGVEQFLVAVHLQEAVPSGEEDAEHDELEDALAGDVPPHDLGDEVVAPAHRRPPHHVVARRLRRQRQRAQGVHDQVHPQQLHDRQRRAP